MVPRDELLTGVRVLDLTGPDAQLCGRIVAELGAEVILVEPPGGDASRHLGPFVAGRSDTERSIAFAALNAGKKSVVLDPADAEAREQLRALAETADAIVVSRESAWRGAVDVDTFRSEGRPVVVVSPFGEGGPYDTFKGPEIVTTALGGLLYFSGDPDRAPCTPPGALGQHFASVWAALALVSGIWASRTQRLAARYEVSTQETLATIEHLIRAAAMDGSPITRNGSQHKTVAPARVFRSRDGYVYIYVSLNHWKIFLGAWQPHPAEFDDPKWVPNVARRKGAARLNAAVEAWTTQFSTAEVVTTLQAAGVPCLAVNKPSEFLADAQVRDRQLTGNARHPRLGTYRALRSPAVVDGVRPPPAIPPLLGEHTEAVLRRVRSQAVAT